MTRKKQRFLTEDHIYRDLTTALGLLFVLGPVLNHLMESSKIDSYLTVAFLIFALYELTRRTSDVVIGLALGLPAVAGGVFNAATPDTPTINLAPVVLTALFLGFLVWRILKDLANGSRISSEKIYGAVCAYLLIGFLFASVYGFVALVDPDAFAFSAALKAELAGRSGQHGFGIFTYFSFVTMSTLGYGDISPVSSTACTIAWMHAVIGQLYLAIMIAGLVGSHIASKRG
jgi:voltage-gated potassium channel